MIRRSPRVADVHFFIGDSFPKYMDLPGVGSQVISAGSPRESSFMSLAKLARLGPAIELPTAPKLGETPLAVCLAWVMSCSRSLDV